MRRLAAIVLPCTMLLSGLSLVVGNAASLDVRAGIVQVFQIEIEPLPTVDVWVDVHEVAGQSGQVNGTTTLGPYRLIAGQSYHVELNSGSHRDCPAGHGVAEPTRGGPFVAADRTHVLCVQKSHDWSVVLRSGTADGPIVSPS